MPSLSEKLKALGVNIGTDGLLPASKTTKYPIEKIIDGQEVNTPFGQTFVVDKTYSSDPRSENLPLRFTASLATLSTWIGDPNIIRYKPESFAFLDTETSGLAGGTGTYAFMIGIGRFTEDGFSLSQFFMRDPIEEPAQLAAVLGALDGCKVLVTYNGKSFDVPLLNTRFITNGEPPPLKSYAHIDLLHLARRLWRDRLQSRTLGSIEENILGVVRTEEDIPGWMVPSIYFDYIKNGGLVEHGIDLIAIGKVFEDMREFDAAAECFARGLEYDIPRKVRGQAIQRWSLLEKRRNNIDISIQLWQNAVEYEEIYAHVELAKAFEHRLRDYAQAIFWTEQAVTLIQSPGFPDIERSIWESQLLHRLGRLMRKFERSK
jgi:uncharacterized protein YprB with RNaseH-like and TPR domain